MDVNQESFIFIKLHCPLGTSVIPRTALCYTEKTQLPYLHTHTHTDGHVHVRASIDFFLRIDGWDSFNIYSIVTRVGLFKFRVVCVTHESYMYIYRSFGDAPDSNFFCPRVSQISTTFLHECSVWDRDGAMHL